MDSIYNSNIKKSLEPLFDHWDVILERNKEIDFKFALPNYFFELHQDISVESLVDLITEKLKEKNIFSFKGPVSNYVFSLGYSDEKSHDFFSFQNFYEIFVSQLSKYGDNYRGVLAIDITEWVEHNACSSKKFLAFLDFMSSIDDDTFGIYISKSPNVEKNKEAAQILQTKSRIRHIKIDGLNSDDALYFINNYLDDMKFVLSKDAEGPLFEIVQFILQVDGGQGLRSVKQFIDDVIYDIVTKNKKFEKVITKSVLEKFMPGGKWASNFKNSRKKYLGFIGE